MFSNMMGMMGKLKEAKKQVELEKEKMDSEYFRASSKDKLLTVEINLNSQIREITIDNDLMKDKEQLEDYLLLVLNNALKKSTTDHENRIMSVAKKGMPKIPGIN